MRRLLPPIFFILSLGMSKSFANVVGADTQNFNPTTNGLDFVTVQSSETLKPGILNFGLFLNYAVNSLPNYEDTATQTRFSIKDSLLSSDVNMGVGLTQNWDMGVSLPSVLRQTQKSDVESAKFSNTGITEVRANTKYRFIGDDQGGLAGVFSMNLNQIEDNPFTGKNPGPTFNFEFAADTTLDKWVVGASVGYRLRNSGKPIDGIPVEPFGNQYILSAAASYLYVPWNSKFIFEVYGSLPAEEVRMTTDRSISSAEILLGMKSDLTTGLALHVGAGSEIIHGTASPDWRVYAGLNWAMGPVFAKNENYIVKADDASNPEPFSGPTQPQESFVAHDVLFEFNSVDVRPEAIPSLVQMVQYLQENQGLNLLTIEGHTDSVGNSAYNLDLSQRRAESVRVVLIRELKVAPNKIIAVGRGEEVPVADNGNYQGRTLNRRVEFKIQR